MVPSPLLIPSGQQIAQFLKSGFSLLFMQLITTSTVIVRAITSPYLNVRFILASLNQLTTLFPSPAFFKTAPAAVWRSDLARNPDLARRETRKGYAIIKTKNIKSY